MAIQEKKQSIWAEFRKFISKGNVIDLAVGVIIGSSFTSIVNSLVKDVIMPPIGFIIGRVNFADLKIVLLSASTDELGKEIPEVAVLYGSFLQASLNFILVAIVVFTMVKIINTFKRKEEKEQKNVDTELSVLKEIREALAKKKS